jgi:hypothetical protein
VQRVLEILETPLAQPVPPLQGGMDAVDAGGGYAQGINVHAGGREDATTAAYRLLLAHQDQEGVSLEDITAAYDDFMRVLNTLDEPRRSNVRIALGLEARKAGSFGGLLSGRVSSCGLDMMPQDLLGRLWHFASRYKDPAAVTPEDDAREQDLAREGVFSALADAIESSGHLVCNPGKLQRMVVRVLQGRLQGVNVDGREFVPDSSGAASGSGDARTPSPTPADTTALVIGGWNRYKEALDREAAVGDLEAFAKGYKVDNPAIDERAFAANIDALREEMVMGAWDQYKEALGREAAVSDLERFAGVYKTDNPAIDGGVLAAIIDALREEVTDGDDNDARPGAA